jgi:hypothetical protein
MGYYRGMRSPEYRTRRTIAAVTAAALGVVSLGSWGVAAHTGRENIKTEFVATYLGDGGCLRDSAYGGALKDRVDVDGVAFPGDTTVELAPNESLIANQKLPLEFELAPHDGLGYRFQAATEGTGRVLAAYDC